MDRMVYIAMTGARENLHAQSVNNHNLANANTHGFRQALAYAFHKPLRGPVFDSRDYVQIGNEVIDFTKGIMQTTGRDLDVAIQGEGFFAVQAPDGTEAYTRAGNLFIDTEGVLRTATGLPVLGDGGPIAIPPVETLTIGRDGTITARPLGAAPNALAAIERLKLVNPPVAELTRGGDGLLRLPEGEEAPLDADVRLVSGMLETSNVNTVAALTRMMELTRQYETNVRMMSTADSLSRSASRLLAIS